MTTEPTSNPTIDDNSVTGRDAEWFLKGFFRGKKWEPRKEDPDRFLDYVVEPDDSGEPSGKRFGVQVKGKLQFDSQKGGLSHSFKTKHLRYYLRKCRFPVFIFRFDTTSGKGYWLFAQQYVKEKLDKKKLETQKTVTLNFEKENNTADFARFQEALSTALKYIEELHPGPIDAAIRNRQAELEEKDPRFRTDVSFVGGCEHVTFHAITPVSLKLTLKAPATDVSSFWKRGLPTTFDKFSICGSPIFENTEQMKLLIHGVRRPGSIRLLTEDGTPPISIEVPGEFYCGAEYATFRGAWPGAPFGIEIPFPRASGIPQERALQLQFNWVSWSDQSILFLPHYDNVRATIAALHKPKLIMEVFGEGNLLSRAVVTRRNEDKLDNEREVIEWLDKCRLLARHFSVNPPLPSISKITARQWQTVEELYELFKTGASISSAADVSWAFNLEETEAIQKIAGLVCGAVKFAGKEQIPFDLIGAPVLVGPLIYEYTDVSIVEAPPTTGLRYQLKGRETSKQIMRLATSEEANA